MSDWLLEASGIGGSYGGVTILEAVDLRVARGTIVAVLGPTGVGKTSLFRAILGEQRASAGEVKFAGQCLGDMPLWRRVKLGMGYLPQGTSVLPDLTVEGNLRTFERLVGGQAYGASYWAEMVGLAHRLQVKASSLSGGERRLLEISRALLARPKLIICDEPFAGMDPIAASRIALLLKEQASKGIAIVISDHHASIALGICERAVLLLGGRVHVQASPEEFVNNALVREHYLGGIDSKAQSPR